MFFRAAGDARMVASVTATVAGNPTVHKLAKAGDGVVLRGMMAGAKAGR